MKVLVAVASKHGATAEIGGAIGEALQQRGFEATLSPAGGEYPKGYLSYLSFDVGDGRG